jgi:glycine/D-amino acid oxidase-like deaminating enzyme
VAVSFWAEEAADVARTRDPLDGDERVDVAIVGAGFTGLWTARELLRRDPGRRVLVVEAERVAFGASGRNGAWLSSGLGVTGTELARRTSVATARRTIEAMRATVDHTLTTIAEDGVDAHVRRGGTLRIARGRHEAAAPAAALERARALGVADGLEVLDADGLAQRVRVADAHGALLDPWGATVQPARLAHGIAAVVERLGGRIVEGTRVTRVRAREGSQPARVETARGTVSADAVLVATEAWTAHLPGHRRRVMPVYSLIVLTAPVDDATWSAIGWERHELLSSHRYTVDYLSRTVDGRVLFGGRGAPYHLGSRIRPEFDHHGPTHDGLRAQLASWFPPLEGVGFSHAWGGPLGMPRDWMPTFTYDPATGIGGAYGYTGQGVATANLAGRVLADLVVDGDTEWADLPMVDHRGRRWEPEPLRWLAARFLQVRLAAIDERAARTGRAPTGRSLAERLVRH